MPADAPPGLLEIGAGTQWLVPCRQNGGEAPKPLTASLPGVPPSNFQNFLKSASKSRRKKKAGGMVQGR